MRDVTCPRCGRAYPQAEGGPEGICPHCGGEGPAYAFEETLPLSAEALAQEAEAPRRRKIDRYEIVGEIGRGGYGVVYRAYDPELKRSVALKVMLSAQHASADDVRRFLREAESAAKLKHPNIVPIHELKQFEGLPFYTMDYVAGVSLDRLAREHRPGVAESLKIVLGVADALEHAHGQGIVHRDLKPANIVIDEHGEPQVTDFGLAKVLRAGQSLSAETALTRTGTMLGTPYYMAPEQAAGKSKEVDGRADVYSLGCILYELLCGVPPFVAANDFEIYRMHLEDEPIPLRQRGVRIAADAETICLKCLEKDPKRRYQAAGELAADIRCFLAGDPIWARRASRLYVLGKRFGKHRTVLAVAALAVAGMAVLAVVREVAAVVGVAAALTVTVAAWSYARILRERNDARRARDEALQQQKAAEDARAEAVAAAEREMEEIRKRTELEAASERVQAQLDSAREIQAHLLPAKVPQLPGFDIYQAYSPAQDVGGDYFDFIPVDRERLGVAVADVSGAGLPGAMMMSSTRTVLRMLAAGKTSAAATLAQTNAIVARDIKRGMFVTALYGVLDVRQRTFTVSSAGHNPMVLVRAGTGRCELVNPRGIAMGLDKGPIFERAIKEETVRLGAGDRVVLYTDGIVEAMNERRQQFGAERFYRWIEANAGLTSRDFVRALLREVDEHRGDAEQNDDITLVTFRVT